MLSQAAAFSRLTRSSNGVAPAACTQLHSPIPDIEGASPGDLPILLNLRLEFGFTADGQGKGGRAKSQFGQKSA